MRKSSITFHTLDFGDVTLSAQPGPKAARWLEKLLDDGLWEEVRKFPKPLVRKLLPSLRIPPETKMVLRFACHAR